ncbi:MAG: response regulator transcription factor [Candidatus Omnitrophica bacterium]|nr:response regulator transcription factor [Candidatus Omnitrophota bacterium]
MMEEAKKKILLVEDDKDFSEVLRMRLEKLNFEVTQLYDGMETIKATKETSPDVIILDIFLPEMDGFTVLKSLKAEKSPCVSGKLVSDVPVIVMTGKAPMMEETVRFEGACEFLTKPLDIDALVRRIAQILKEDSSK